MGRTCIEVGADVVPGQDGHAAAALLVEHDLEGLRDSVLARVVEARQEDNEALLQARGITLAEGFDDGPK